MSFSPAPLQPFATSRFQPHIYGARKLVDLGLINDRPHVQFVMGIKNALPAEARILDLLHSEFQRVLPNATWTAAGIGRNQAEVTGWVLARDGTAVRTGLEDNIRVTKDRLARSNAELVQIAAETCARLELGLLHQPKLGCCLD
jgi:3-keto-5-aminohexanoate cleavage enzyme